MARTNEVKLKDEIRNYATSVSTQGDYLFQSDVPPMEQLMRTYFETKAANSKADYVNGIFDILGGNKAAEQNLTTVDYKREEPVIKNAILDVADTVFNYTDDNNLTALLREQIRMSYVTATMRLTNSAESFANEEDIKRLANLNMDDIASVLSSIQGIENIDNFNNIVKKDINPYIISLVDLANSTNDANVKKTLQALIGCTESFFVIGNILKTLVLASRVAGPNLVTANSNANNGINIADIGAKPAQIQSADKMTAIDIGNNIADICDTISSIDPGVDIEAVEDILFNRASNVDILDIKNIMLGLDHSIYNKARLMDCVSAFNGMANDPPVPADLYLNLGLLMIAELSLPAETEITHEKVLEAFCDICRTNITMIPGYTYMDLSSVLEFDMTWGTSIATATFAQVDKDIELYDFAIKFLSKNGNKQALLTPEAIIARARKTDSALRQITIKDVSSYISSVNYIKYKDGMVDEVSAAITEIMNRKFLGR